MSVLSIRIVLGNINLSAYFYDFVNCQLQIVKFDDCHVLYSVKLCETEPLSYEKEVKH